MPPVTGIKHLDSVKFLEQRKVLLLLKKRIAVPYARIARVRKAYQAVIIPGSLKQLANGQL
jgi:hypothetical protein